jgi:mRNA interferase MazF
MPKGEIWLVDIPATGGHEQQGLRPVILMAELEANMAMVIPCTSNLRALRFPHILEINPDFKNGLSILSVALIFQLRALDRKRLSKKIGSLDASQIRFLDEIIKSMLKLM